VTVDKDRPDEHPLAPGGLVAVVVASTGGCRASNGAQTSAATKSKATEPGGNAGST